mmetsp:Transcript_19793/g.66555  ORF Transcript_19793/g.66555 Transcript_19793/m.66555 type:complete len:299 (+) Transcript_19793:1797-2693(+)
MRASAEEQADHVQRVLRHGEVQQAEAVAAHGMAGCGVLLEEAFEQLGLAVFDGRTRCAEGVTARVGGGCSCGGEHRRRLQYRFRLLGPRAGEEGLGRPLQGRVALSVRGIEEVMQRAAHLGEQRPQDARWLGRGQGCVEERAAVHGGPEGEHLPRADRPQQGRVDRLAPARQRRLQRAAALREWAPERRHARLRKGPGRGAARRPAEGRVQAVLVGAGQVLRTAVVQLAHRPRRAFEEGAPIARRDVRCRAVHGRGQAGLGYALKDARPACEQSLRERGGVGRRQHPRGGARVKAREV